MTRRCLKCPCSALPELDLCLLCSHAELATQGRAAIKRNKKRRKQVRTLASVSVSAETYERIKRAAEERGWTVRQVVERAVGE